MRDAVRRSISILRKRNAELRRRLGLYRALVAAFAVATAVLGAVALAGGEPKRSAAVSLGTGLAGVRSPAPPPESPPPESAGGDEGPPPEAASQSLGEGEASYYHSSLEGRPTASGEAYRGAELTAAHRSLPIGSRVRVTNLGNQEAVVVRVNDRGPFAKRRVIDLSRAAASELGMIGAGRARVRLELLR